MITSAQLFQAINFLAGSEGYLHLRLEMTQNVVQLLIDGIPLTQIPFKIWDEFGGPYDEGTKDEFFKITHPDGFVSLVTSCSINFTNHDVPEKLELSWTGRAWEEAAYFFNHRGYVTAIATDHGDNGEKFILTHEAFPGDFIEVTTERQTL